MKTVFFDVDTQIDFLYPAGALYVPGAERLVDAVAQLNRYAAAHGIPVVSTMDAHTENDPEFQRWPPHCVAGTAGQQKPARTLLDQRIVIPTAPGDHPVAAARQIIVEKQQIDPFTNPNLPRLLELLDADRYVVYGVVTEYCVARGGPGPGTSWQAGRGGRRCDRRASGGRRAPHAGRLRRSGRTVDDSRGSLPVI